MYSQYPPVHPYAASSGHDQRYVQQGCEGGSWPHIPRPPVALHSAPMPPQGAGHAALMPAPTPYIFKQWVKDHHGGDCLRAHGTEAASQKARGDEISRERANTKNMAHEDKISYGYGAYLAVIARCSVAARGTVQYSIEGNVAQRMSPHKFTSGQSIIQWWASWFKTIPDKVGKARPAWFFGEVLAVYGFKSIWYAGLKRTAQPLYICHGWNGGGEVVPESFIAARLVVHKLGTCRGRPCRCRPQAVHSDGRLVTQPDPPDWQVNGWVPIGLTEQVKPAGNNPSVPSGKRTRA